MLIISRLTISKFILALAMTLVTFRTFLDILVGPISYAVFILIFIFGFIYILPFLLGKRFPKVFFPLFLFYYYILFSLVSYHFISIFSAKIPSFIGFFNLMTMSLFWAGIWLFSYNSKKDFFDYFVSIMIFFGIINSIGALIQFFISPTIFGLTRHMVYTDILTMANPVVTKRAISFISSPQSLAIFLCAPLIFAVYKPYKSVIVKTLTILLILTASVLTGSKAMAMFFIILVLCKIIFERSVLALFVSIGAATILSLVSINSNSIARMFDIIHAVNTLTTHVRFEIWMNFLFYPTTPIQFFLGHGLGALSRGSELLTSNFLLNGSAESFIIQLYFELGIIGLILFLGILFMSIKNLLKATRTRYLAYLLISLFINMLTVPTFYSFTTSFFYWGIIIYGLIAHEDRPVMS